MVFLHVLSDSNICATLSSLVLGDMGGMERHLSDVYAAQQECPAMADTVVLLRVWARQRGLSQVREEREEERGRRGGREEGGEEEERGCVFGKVRMIIPCVCHQRGQGQRRHVTRLHTQHLRKTGCAVDFLGYFATCESLILL